MLANVTDIADSEDVGPELLLNLQIELLRVAALEILGHGEETAFGVVGYRIEV